MNEIKADTYELRSYAGNLKKTATKKINNEYLYLLKKLRYYGYYDQRIADLYANEHSMDYGWRLQQISNHLYNAANDIEYTIYNNRFYNSGKINNHHSTWDFYKNIYKNNKINNIMKSILDDLSGQGDMDTYNLFADRIFLSEWFWTFTLLNLDVYNLFLYPAASNTLKKYQTKINDMVESAKEEWSDKITSKTDFVVNRATDLVNIINNFGKDAKGYETLAKYIEYTMTGESSFKLPSIFSEVSSGIGFINGILDTNKKLDAYTEALEGDDTDEKIKTGMDTIRSVYGLCKGLVDYKDKISKVTGLEPLSAMDIFDVKKQLIDTGIKFGLNSTEMVLLDIANNESVGETVYDALATSALETIVDFASDNVVILYTPVETVSYGIHKLTGADDLQTIYERVSDKKGYEAVTDSLKQMKNLLIEESSFESWKSGMGLIIDGVKKQAGKLKFW